MTKCQDCQHLRSSGPIWYSNRCAKVEQPARFDPITGENEPPELEYVREVNNGECGLFELLDVAAPLLIESGALQVN